METIEVNPSQPAEYSVIWLHGLGADGNDFVPIVPELTLPTTLPVRFIFPHAPIMPITINNGYEMRAWFDLYDLSFNRKVDERGIQHSIDRVSGLIQKENARGIPSHHIVLAGFSQGAVIALTTGLTYPEKLGGLIALSGYLPNLPAHASANAATPIFIAHGEEDPMVPFLLGERTYDALREAHYPVSWHSYPMPHSVCPEEIRDISRWLIQTLAKNKGNTAGE